MAYDIFSQPQGPNIQVSLFGDAARTGASLGQAIPSAISSIVQGTQEGYKYGQEAAIRQNQIDQQPITNRLREAQTVNEEAVARVNTARADTLEQDAKRQDDFITAFKNAAPQDQANMVIGGQYADVFAKDKNLYQQSLQSIYANPDNGIDQNLRDNIGRILKIKTTTDYYDKLKQQRYPKYVEAQDEVRSSPLTQAIADKIDVPVDSLPGAVEFYPHGYRAVNPSTGKWALDPATNKPAINPAFQGTNSGDRFDVFSHDGTLLFDGGSDTSNISGDGRKAYHRYRTEASFQNGTQTGLALTQVVGDTQKTNKAQVKGPPVNVPTLNEDKQTGFTEAPKEEDPIKASIKTTFGVDDAVVQKLEAPIKDLKSNINAYATIPGARTNPATVSSINSTLNTIARTISDSQYSSSDALQAQYTQGDVDAYNKALANSVSLGEETSPGVYKLARGAGIYDAFKVSTPQDLYFVKQQKVLDSQLQTIVNKTVEEAQARSTQALRAQTSRNRTLSFLSKVANGVQPNQ